MWIESRRKVYTKNIFKTKHSWLEKQHKMGEARIYMTCLGTKEKTWIAESCWRTITIKCGAS